MQLLSIGIGGFLGAISRYLVGVGVHRFVGPSRLPWGTLAVNVLGCLAIGYLAHTEHWRGRGPHLADFALAGFLGGFTTFSTFGSETFGFLQRGDHVGAFGNVALNVVVGLLAVWLGWWLAR